MSKLFWLKLAATLATLIASGCIQQPSQIVLPPHDGIVIDSHVAPINQPTNEIPKLTVSVSRNTTEMLAKFLGSDGVTFTRGHAIDDGDTHLVIPAGCKVDWIVKPDGGTFTFSDPFATIKLPWLLHTTLRSLDVVGDTGTAHTGLGSKEFSIAWSGKSGAEAVDLPVVFAYSQPACPPCEAAKKAFADAVDLPFRVQWSDKAPAWVGSRPTFHWQASGDDWRKREQWDGVEKFVEMWKRSREPKKAKVSASADPFVQSDRPSTSRQLAYNASHTCQKCGRTQCDIKDEHGPVANSHVHRCDHCGQEWFHEDKSTSVSKQHSGNFLFWRW